MATAIAPCAKALALLLAKYVESPKLGPVSTSLGFSTDKASEELLRAILAKNPSRDVQGQTAMALAMLLKHHRDSAERRDDPAASKKLDQEIEALYDRVVKEYSDVKSAFRGTVGKTAEAELYEIRSLCVGKVAPDIKGKDSDGKEFKLSDYRGKVVLIDFWASWCVPCMALVPHARETVKRLDGKPFVVVGVNVDKTAETLKSCEEKNEMTWRSFHDGVQGPVSQHWNIHGIPMLYILDHNGVIRFKSLASPGDAVLDKHIDALVKEAEQQAKVSTK